MRRPARIAALFAAALVGWPGGAAAGVALTDLAVPATAAETAAAGIGRVVEAMEHAVRRADSGAYMAMVDASDAVFAEEQRKWARDLRVRPVAAFDLSLGGPPEPRGDGVWAAPLSVSWRLPGEETDRGVSFDALFRPVGLPTGAWVYAGRVWEELHGDGVRVLVQPGDADAAEMAGYLVGRVGAILDSVEAELEQPLSVEPTIKIYPDMKSLQASIALSYTDALGGWNEPGESIKLLGRRGMAGPRLDATVAHEIGHAVSFEYGAAIITAPWWSLEGIAEVVADPFRTRPNADAAAALARAGRLMPFAALSDFRGEAMNHGRQVYVQGRSMLAYIGARFGRTARNDWLRAMGAGATLDEASVRVLGVPFGTLESDWRAAVEAQAEEPAPNQDA
jgi:hypothetical protein